MYTLRYCNSVYYKGSMFAMREPLNDTPPASGGWGHASVHLYRLSSPLVDVPRHIKYVCVYLCYLCLSFGNFICKLYLRNKLYSLNKSPNVHMPSLAIQSYTPLPPFPHEILINPVVLWVLRRYSLTYILLFNTCQSTVNPHPYHSISDSENVFVIYCWCIQYAKNNCC